MNRNGHQEEAPKHDRDRAIVQDARRQVEAAKLEDGNTIKLTPMERQIPAADAVSGPLPDSFSGYDLVRQIHRGGQGVVYQAIQRTTKRKVAIKVLREGPFADARDKARFEREVQILGQLNHPNIVGIHDSGIAAGNVYYVMDYISGQSLDVYMASHERSIEETLHLFADICEAISAAHLRGVIHRDLKPGNIRIDHDGRPHVLDFGLAKTVMGEAIDGSHAQVISITGQFVGSAPWAAPEQAEGVPSKIDIRTDVYSLGVILFQMLTGRFPYKVTGNIRDVLDNILKAEPIRPRTIRKQITNELETIILKCLSKERERRYQSAGELGRDIRHYLAGEPIEAKRESTLYVLKKSLARHRNKLVGGGIVLLAALGLIGALLWQQAGYLAYRRLRESESLTQSARMRIFDRKDLPLAESELMAALERWPDSPDGYLMLCALYAIRGLDAGIEEKDRFTSLAVQHFHRSHLAAGGTSLLDNPSATPVASESAGQGSAMTLRAAADLMFVDGDHDEAERFYDLAEKLSRQSGQELSRSGIGQLPPLYELRHDRLVTSRPRFDTPQIAGRAFDESATIVRILSRPMRDLNPLKTALPDEYIEELIYDPLYLIDSNGQCVPNDAVIAAHVEKDSGATWEIEIKPNLTWHDGRPLTVNDIAFTWATFRSALSSPIDSVSLIGEGRIAFHRAQGRLAPFHLQFPILPRHIYERMKNTMPGGDEEKWAREFLLELGKRPIGNGPYRTLEERTSDRMTLVRWDDYPGTLPYVARVVFQVVPDPTKRSQMLAEGDADEMELTWQEWAWHVNGESFADKVDKLRHDKWQYDYIGWNLAAPDSPFADVRTRRAIRRFPTPRTTSSREGWQSKTTKCRT